MRVVSNLLLTSLWLTVEFELNEVVGGIFPELSFYSIRLPTLPGTQNIETYINVEYCKLIGSVEYICKDLIRRSELALFGMERDRARTSNIQNIALLREADPKGQMLTAETEHVHLHVPPLPRGTH